MVKAVVGEETQLQLAEDRLSRSSTPAQVGLVIGKLSSALDRGFVFDLLPTPQNDAGQPACSLMEAGKDEKKKGVKSKSQAADSSSLVIDHDWVAEHARQVSRMLVGGMNVVGVYVWASEVAFKNSTMELCQAIKAVAEAASMVETDLDERLIVHISYSPRRWTCRNCTVSSNMSSRSFRPCDFKMGRVLTSLQTFKCSYNFDLRLPIYSASSSQTLGDILRHGISVHAEELRNAKAIIDGALVFGDETCTKEGLHEVQLLLPFMKDIYIEARSQKDIVGIVVLSGSVCSFAHLNSKEPISHAIADIKGDIIRSLQSRLDILCDEVDGVPGANDDGNGETTNATFFENPVLHPVRKACNLSLPRRVFVPWLTGAFVCDYLQPSETFEVVKDHCVELMSMEAPKDTSTILEPEAEAPRAITRSFWDVVGPTNNSTEKSKKNSNVGSGQKTIKSTNINIIFAIFFLLLAIIVGYVLIIR